VKKRLIELDFVRGVGILAVMAYHYVGVTKAPDAVAKSVVFLSSSGWAGVDLFFVLSGYLVAGLLFSEYNRTNDVRFGRFLFRRALKIWPSYYFYLLIQVIVRRHPLSSFLVQNLSNLQNYLGTSLEHTWSLAVEEHFYIVLAVLFAAWKTERISKLWFFRICAFLCAAILILRTALVFSGHPGGVAAYTHTRLDSMLFGVILAWLSFFDHSLFKKMVDAKYTLCIVAASAAIFALVLPKSSPVMLSVGFTILYLGSGAFILLITGHAGKVKEWRLFKFVAWIGFYSYSIYLWHFSVREPIQKFLSRHLSVDISWWLAPFVEAVAAIIVSVAISRMIEWPILKMRDRLMPEKEIQAVAA
jgi:peptidoglycan/LPS O-acetylase OafA/YrhL